MSHDHQQTKLARETFSFEEYSDLMAGLDGRVMIKDPKQSPWTAEYLSLDGITLHRIYEGGSNTYEGAGAPGVIGLFLRIPTPSEVRVDGSPVEVDNLCITRPGIPVSSSVTGDFHYYTLSLSTERIVAAMEGFDPAHTKRLLNGPCKVQITQESGRRVAELAGSILTTAGGDGAFQNLLTQRTAACELLDSFLEAFTSRIPSAPNLGRPRIPQSRLLEKIRDWAHRPDRKGLSVQEMASQLGVAERTLRKMFWEHFGVSPKGYLKLIQVHEIRADLLRAGPSANVTSIASDHGVWDFGRLARRYRLVFGENPSQTLRRP